MLIDLAVYTNSSTLPCSQSISTLHLTELFLKKLRPYRAKAGKCNRINIYLSTNINPSLQKHTLNIWDCHWNFDCTNFEQLAIKDKEKVLLDTILSALLFCCTQEDWDKQPFNDAYQKCLDLNMVNEWWFKNKLFLSPNKMHYTGLYNVYNFEGHEIYLVLFNASKIELARQKVFKDRSLSFDLEWLVWKDDNTIQYKFTPPQKIFAYTIADILSPIPIQLPSKFSNYFK